LERKVTENDVAFFKESMCNENTIIIDIICNELQNVFIPPILDVGYGIGDLAYFSLENKEVIGIDVNELNKDKYPIRNNHKRVKSDFFEYNLTKKINTLFISHTLQFIQNDIKKLNNKIAQINSKNIILVANRNDDFLGEVIKWVFEKFGNASPELRIKRFPVNYKLTKKIPFIANLKCSNFKILAEQISYLMLIDINKREQEVITFLKQNLKKPEFTINQDILIYERR
jgi:hypothetical protein